MPKFAVKAKPATAGEFFTIISAKNAEEAKDYAQKNWDDLEWVSVDLEPEGISEVIEDVDGSYTRAFEEADEGDEEYVVDDH